MGSSASVLKDIDGIPLEIRNLLDMCELQLTRILENDHEIINREMSKIFKKHTDIIAAVTSHTKGQLKKLYSSNTNSNPFGLYALLALGNNYAYVYKMLFMSKDNIENHSFKISAQAEYDEGILKSIVGTSTSKEIKQFRIVYETERRVSLIDVVKLRAGFNTPIQKFLLKVLKADRSDEDIVDREAAIVQAKEIHKAGASRFFGVEEDPIFDILSKASRAQCVAISEEYMDSFKMTLSNALKKKFGGNIGKLLLLWILPVDCAVATLIKNTCSKLITNQVAIIRIIAKYDKPFLAKVDQACFKLFNSTLLNIVGKALSGNVFKAIKGWIENSTPDNGTESELDDFIAKKKYQGCTNDDIFNDIDSVEAVKDILLRRSEAFEKFMFEQKISFQFSDKSMAALHDMNSAAVEQSNRRRSSDVSRRPKLVQPPITPTAKEVKNLNYLKDDDAAAYDDKAKKVSKFLNKEFEKFDDDKVGEFVTEDFWYIVKTLPLADLGMTVEEVDFMSANCDWEVKGHIHYHDAVIELTDGIINSIEDKPTDNDVYTVLRRLEHEDITSDRKQSHITADAERVETHKKKQKKPKKEKPKLPPHVENYIFDTFDSFDYDCKGYLDSFEMEKFIEASNIQLPLTSFYSTSEDAYTHEDVTKVFAKEIDKVLTANLDPMYLCFMDKDSGAFFWYNVLDGSTKWVTENEVIDSASSSSRRYNPSQHNPQIAVHYLPQDDYDDSNQYLGHNYGNTNENISEEQTETVKEEEIINLTEEQKINGKKTLVLWLSEGVKLSPDLVDTYSDILLSAGMTSSADVGSRIEKNSGILQSLGISNTNVALIQQALIKQKVNQLSLSTTGVSSVDITMLPTPDASKTTLPDIPEAKKEKEENIDEKDLCLICFENRKCMVFFPCGHLCVCESCDMMMNRKQGVLCIMCRVEIQNRAKLFTT